MAKTNTELSQNLVSEGAKMTPLVIQQKLENWKLKHESKLIALAKDKAIADRIFVICMNTITKNPYLLECTFESIAACILQSFQLQLFPGPFGEVAYVPLRNRNLNGAREANFWPEYQGLIKLMLNAGNKCVISRVVREGDTFEFNEGLDRPLYIPAAVAGRTRGKVLFTYATVCTRAGLWQTVVVDEDEIESVKARSKGAQKSDSPWNSQVEYDVDAMRCKTAVKRVSKFCSKSPELMIAVSVDEHIDAPATSHFNLVKGGSLMPTIDDTEEPKPLIEAPKEQTQVNLGVKDTITV